MARGRAERPRRGTAPGTALPRRGASKIGPEEARSVQASLAAAKSAHAKCPHSKLAAAMPAKAKSQEAELRGRLAVAEEERDALRLGLQRAEARIQSLEKTQAQVRDRIAWALESLQNVLEGKP